MLSVFRFWTPSICATLFEKPVASSSFSGSEIAADGGRLVAILEEHARSNMMIERCNQSVLNAVRDVCVNGASANAQRRAKCKAERVEAFTALPEPPINGNQYLHTGHEAVAGTRRRDVITDAGQPRW